MAEEELVDFGFSAVTADEYERDNTDGENTGSGGSASPEALASIDLKIEQIMAHLASKSDEKDDGWSTSDAKEDLETKLKGIESKLDEVLVLERDEERAQTTADILSQLNDATEATSETSGVCQTMRRRANGKGQLDAQLSGTGYQHRPRRSD